MAPAEVKATLAMALGPNAESYWRTFSDFLQAKISRAEFEDLISDKLNTPHLRQLHNTLLMEIIGAACASEPDTLTTNLIMPANKRRRVHPYQGNEDDGDTFHSSRLKQWVVSLPSKERQDLGTEATYAETHPREQRLLLEEVWQERGYEVDVGRRPTASALALCTLTRALPSLPDLHERTRAVAMEHGLSLNPNTARTFAKLFNQALEEFLTKIVTATLTTITRSDSQYESIQPPANVAAQGSFAKAKNANSKVTISVMALATTFYITPSIVSFPSPAMLRVLMQEFQWLQNDEEDEAYDKRKGSLFLGAKPMADYYRLLRVSRSGGRSILQEYPALQ